MVVNLLERDHELATLHVLLDETTTSQGRIALISGEAGIGKTTLVERFVAAAPAGTRVLWGACEALFAPRPLGPLYDIAVHLPPTIRASLEGAAQRATLFAAVLEDLRSKPTVLVIEDLHWADEATLDFIKYLARRIAQTKTLLLLTYRDEELGRDHPLRLVMGDLPTRETTRLRLLPLSRDAVTTLAKKTARPERGLQDLYAATGGNPFFVTEILASDVADVAQAPLSVSDAVLVRVARRSREARRLLEVASVSPARIERWVLEALGAGDDVPLDECLATGLLSLDGQMLSFRHELARQAVEGALPPARRQTLNAQVLHALLASEVEPAALARLAHHATQAEDAALVLRFAPEAARQAAARGAHREAAAHYQTALRYANRLDSAQQAEVLDELANEQFLCGHMEDATQSCEAALARWRTLDRQEQVGHDLRLLSHLEWYLVRNADAERHSLAAVALLETLPPDRAGRELAKTYADLAIRRMVEGDTAGAKHWGGRAITLAEQLGDGETALSAQIAIGSAEMSSGDEGGQGKLERGLRLALEHGYEELVARSYANMTCHLVWRRSFVQATRLLRDGLEYCTEHDLDSWMQYLRGMQARAHLYQGDWIGAEEQATAILQAPRTPVAFRVSALLALGLIRARRGDPGIEALLDEARDLAWATGEPQNTAPTAAACAEWRWLQGQQERCRDEAAVGVQVAVACDRVWYLGEAAIWLWRGGGLSETPERILSPFALEIAGEWRAAANAWEQLGCPYERALALLDGDEAAQRDALAIFERLGAQPAAEIARKRLRQAGARGLPRGPMRATQANPYGLTPRQLEILLLLAEGLHNSEIAERLSTTPKTVEHHVTAVLAKLNARSRAEAVSIAHTAGLIPQMTGGSSATTSANLGG
jgi:DNA-binding CsgD family transcriptional regulator